MSIWCDPRSTIGPPPETLVPAPVPELLHGLEAVLLQPLRRDRVALRPADVRRHGAVPLAVHGHDPPEELRLLEQLQVAVQVARVAAPLVPDLEQPSRLAGGEHHAASALQGVRHLLLAVDVLAGAETVDSVWRVPEVGRRDDDRVDVRLLVEHLAVVFVSPDLVLELPEDVDGPLLVVLRPHVAHGPESEARDPEHRVEQHLPLGAGPENGDVDLGDVLRRVGRLGLRGLPLSLLVLRAAFATRSRRGPGPGRSRGPAERRADRGSSRPPSLRLACRRGRLGPSGLPQPCCFLLRRAAEDLDLDVVVQLVRVVALAVEPHVAGP